MWSVKPIGTLRWLTHGRLLRLCRQSDETGQAGHSTLGGIPTLRPSWRNWIDSSQCTADCLDQRQNSFAKPARRGKRSTRHSAALASLGSKP